MQQFASSIAMARVSAPIITWSDNYSSVTIRGTRVSLDNVREGLFAMEQRVINILNEVSQEKTIPYSIPEDLVDDMTEDAIGYSWLENGHFVKDPPHAPKRARYYVEQARVWAPVRRDTSKFQVRL